MSVLRLLIDVFPSPPPPASSCFDWFGLESEQFDGNTLTENRYSDIYVYYGAAEEVAEVYPFTGINVNNVFRWVGPHSLAEKKKNWRFFFF